MLGCSLSGVQRQEAIRDASLTLLNTRRMLESRLSPSVSWYSWIPVISAVHTQYSKVPEKTTLALPVRTTRSSV